MPCDEQARHVDVVCFTTSDADRPVLPVDHHANDSDADRAVQRVASETGAENDGESGYNNSSDENNLSEKMQLHLGAARLPNLRKPTFWPTAPGRPFARQVCPFLDGSRTISEANMA